VISYRFKCGSTPALNLLGRSTRVLGNGSCDSADLENLEEDRDFLDRVLPRLRGCYQRKAEKLDASAGLF